MTATAAKGQHTCQGGEKRRFLPASVQIPTTREKGIEKEKHRESKERNKKQWVLLMSFQTSTNT